MKEVLIIDSNQESALKLARFLKKGPDASIVDDIDDYVACCIKCEIRPVGRYAPVVVDNVDDSLEKIKSRDLRAVLLNAASSEMIALDALTRIKEEHSKAIVIMIVASGETARKAKRLGASDVVAKTPNMEDLYWKLGLAFCRLYAPNKIVSIPTGEAPNERLIGKGKPMIELHARIVDIAPGPLSVLILGETGTGKELVAQLIHEESGRTGKFVAINCGAMNEGVLESELFGHTAGAYTSAPPKERPGAFRSADGGTLFLDEIGNTTTEFQKRLLRVLEIQEVRPMGGDKAHEVDVRVIAATNQDLKQMVKEGTFREDLLFRLKDHEVYLPPLRERKEDIELLVSHFLEHAPRQRNQRRPDISKPAIKLLEDYHWPGNVRELKKCIESAVDSSQGETILPRDLKPEIRMYRGDEGSEGDAPERQSSEPSEIPIYENLFDLPVVVFCQFISGAENITETDITNWSEELAPHAHRRATDAEREIHEWEQAWKGGRITRDALLTDIGEVVRKAVTRLSELRYGSDSRHAAAEPISIVGKTLDGSLIAVLKEVIKEYGDDWDKAARMLKIQPKMLEGLIKKDGERKRSTESLRKLKPFPDKEVERLLTKSVGNFVTEHFSRAEWRAKSPDEQVRIVHLALKTVSGRLAGDHGCIYFGGMTFRQIKKQIYRRAAYLCKDEAKAAKALDVDVRTFREHRSRSGSEATFPDRYTLF